MLGGRKAGDEIIDGFSTAIGMPSDCRSYALHKFCIDTTGNMVLAESEPFSRRKLFIHHEIMNKRADVKFGRIVLKNIEIEQEFIQGYKK